MEDYFLRSSSVVVFRGMVQDFTCNKSTLVQVMAWCLMAPSHYLNQCWLRLCSSGIVSTMCMLLGISSHGIDLVFPEYSSLSTQMCLTQWGLNKIADILQTIFSDACSLRKKLYLYSNSTEVSVSPHISKCGQSAEVCSHDPITISQLKPYLSQWWHIALSYICISQPQCFKKEKITFCRQYLIFY